MTVAVLTAVTKYLLTSPSLSCESWNRPEDEAKNAYASYLHGSGKRSREHMYTVGDEEIIMLLSLGCSKFVEMHNSTKISAAKN